MNININYLFVPVAEVRYDPNKFKCIEHFK